MAALRALIVIFAAARLTVDAQDVTVGLEHTLYDIPEATSEMICAQIISPDDIGSLEFILQIVLSDDTPTNGDVATPDAENPIFGGFQMAPGSDYRQPLSGGSFQIFEKPFSQSTRSVCYEQLTYNDTVEENDEYFIVELVTLATTPSNIVIEESLSRALVRIVDDDGVEVPCPPLSPPTNGEVNVTNSEAIYSCSPGFRLEGTETRTCDSSGTWTPDAAPICVAVACPALEPPDNGAVNITGNIAIYTCILGYRLNGSETRMCDAGVWSGEDPTCMKVLCPELMEPANGTIMLEGDEGVGQSAFYECNRGYRLEGDTEVLICGPDGMWDNEPPICEEIVCPTLMNPMNGRVVLSGILPGDTAMYTCNPTYTLEGEELRTCQDDGTWNHTEPVCNPVLCPDLPTPANSTVTQSGRRPQDTRVYSCDPGFTLLGRNTQTCQDNGEWNSSIPVCIRVTCPTLPPPANGDVDHSGNDPGDTATFTCNPGYTLNGSPVLNCGDDGLWDSPAPTCQEVVCPVLPIPPNAMLNFDLNFGPGQQATFSCDPDYTLEGEAVLTCENGTWDHPTPSCVLERIVVGFSSLIYSVPEGLSVEICVTVLSPDDIGDAVVYVQVDVNETVSPPSPGQTLATEDTFNFITGELNMAPGADYGQPLRGGSLQIYDQPLSQSVRRVCYNQITYNDSDFEGDEYFGLQLIPELRTLDSVVIDPLLNTAVVVILDDDVICPLLTVPDNGMLEIEGNSPGETFTFSCASGYSLSGEGVLTCQEDGTWDNPTPSCLEVVEVGRVNDTVIGDPLFTVHLPGGEEAMCYEVRGTQGVYLNLVSDSCTSVNALYDYVPSNPQLNRMRQIGIKAAVTTDASTGCAEIDVDVNNCTASIDGVLVDKMADRGDIRVRQFGKQWRVSVSNCDQLSAVMWITCSGEMLRFRIARGSSLSPTSHGLLGQFWGIPVTIVTGKGNGYIELYETGNAKYRRLPYFKYDLTWDHTKTTCYYVGNKQGGSEDSHDSVESVIEGDYSMYSTGSLFETNFEFTRFDETTCDTAA